MPNYYGRDFDDIPSRADCQWDDYDPPPEDPAPEDLSQEAEDAAYAELHPDTEHPLR